MNDILASIYESLSFEQTYSSTLYESGAYVNLFLDMILPSTILLAIFYFLIKYPFCKWYHWLGALLLGGVITWILSYSTLVNILAEYIYDSEYDDIGAFVYQMVFFNVLISIVIGVIDTLIFKLYQGPNRNVPFGGNN